MTVAKKDWRGGDTERGCSFDAPLKVEPVGSDMAQRGAFDLTLPEDCDLIIVMEQTGSGFIPTRLLLPGQAYPRDVAETIQKNAGNHYNEVWLVPVRRSEFIQLAHMESVQEMQARLAAHIAYLQQAAQAV